MPSLESRLNQLEQRMVDNTVKPYVFLVGDDIETAKTDWETKNCQLFPPDRNIVLFRIIKPSYQHNFCR